MRIFLKIIVLGLLISACSSDDEPGIVVGGPGSGGSGGDGDGGTSDPFTYTPSKSLKEIPDYPVGMIVSASKLNSNSTDNQSFKSILNDDFNSITAENDMKMANMFRGVDTYDFSDGDDIVAYAKANGMRVHGHALVWHSSIPSWLNSFSGTDEEFEEQIEKYVKATVAHFAEEKMTVNGKEVSVVASWDVVNEAFEGGGYRNTLFLQRIGSDYLSKVYTWAREADPDVKLFYNDYNVSFEVSKRNAIVNMANDFIANDVPIDGIGFQMHVNHNFPSVSAMTDAINAVVGTGLLVHFSELDVKVNYDDDITALTEERASEQEEMYKIVAQQYKTIPEAQRFGITIWGLRDKDSWLYEGGTDWPLMYDNDFNYKIAHRGFAEGMK